LRKHSESEELDASVRPFWSGTISFGLVSIPVNLFPANRDSKVSLRMLGPDGTPVKRDYVTPDSGKNLEDAETARGFETAQGKVITVTDEELDRLAPEKSRTIDLRLFVPHAEISPLYYNRAYFLTPADKSGKAYRLLAATMERKKRVGIATFVMRGKEYLVAILAENGILRAETLRFADELRKPAEIGLPKKIKVSASAVRKFETAIARAGKKALDAREMRDEYSESMLKLIKQKSAHQKDVVESQSGEPRRKQPTKVVDLMEVLKASLNQGAKAHGKKATRAA
jgi:DNA end-binding protein Ku